MNPAHWTGIQWMNFAAFAIAGLAGGTWWIDGISIETVHRIDGALLYAVSILNFLAGRAAAPSA